MTVGTNGRLLTPEGLLQVIATDPALELPRTNPTPLLTRTGIPITQQNYLGTKWERGDGLAFIAGTSMEGKVIELDTEGSSRGVHRCCRWG